MQTLPFGAVTWNDITTEVEGRFRYWGADGEAAFRAVCFAYHQALGLNGVVPLSCVESWEAAHARIAADTELVARLRDFAREDAGTALPDWYQFFVGRKFRSGSGKFFTPKPVAMAMAHLLQDMNCGTIMDPACGGGTFLAEAVKLGGERTIVGNDVDLPLVELSMLRLALLPAEDVVRYHFLADNIFCPGGEFRSWFGKVDAILANPPFSLTVESHSIESDLFNAGYRNSDALFVDVAYHLLRPGGLLISLFPHSIVANEEFRTMRLLVESRWELRGVICLPEGVFNRSAGTPTRADIVVLAKGVSKVEGSAVFASAPSAGVPLGIKRGDDSENALWDIACSPEVESSVSQGSKNLEERE